MALPIVGLLVNFVAGGGLKFITDALGEAQQRRLNAANATERVEADKEIAGLEARRAVLVAEAQHKINLWFRGFIALGPALYVFSYFAIDKVLCVKLGLSGAMCRVDAINDPVMQGVMAAVLGFYFVTAAMDRRK